MAKIGSGCFEELQMPYESDNAQNIPDSNEMDKLQVGLSKEILCSKVIL